jgi:hypothetical protein
MVAKTLWPALPKARAVARPIPELVPVMRTEAMLTLLSNDSLNPRQLEACFAGGLTGCRLVDNPQSVAFEFELALKG